MKTPLKHPLPTAARIALGLGCAVAGWLIRVPLQPLLGDSYAFVTFYPLVAVAALLFGLWPGVLCTVSSLVFAALFINEPRGVLAIPDTTTATADAIFVLSGVLISVMGSRAARAVTSERAHRESEARFRDIFNVSTAGMAMVDLRGRFLLVNRRFCEITGRSAEELAGTSCGEITHPDDRDCDREMFERALRDHAPFVIEKRYVRPGGEVVWVRNSVSEMRDASGAPTHMLAVSIDITDRKSAERVRQQFATLAESSADFVGLCDLNMRPFYVNAAGLRMVGLESLEQARAATVYHWFYDDDARLLEGEFFPRVLREGRNETEIRFRHFATGDPIWVIYSVVLLRDEDGAPSGFGTVTRNITERRASEEALRRSVQELEQFVAIASHDLKEPLRGIATLAQFVREDDAQALSVQSVSRLERITGLCKRLTDMVNSLLEYAKAGGDRLAEPCDLDQITRRAIDKLREGFEEAKNDIEIVDRLPTISGDPVMLERAMANLISNALKHNASVPRRAEIGAADGEVFVRDNGVGIDPRHHARIFQMFKRVPGTPHDGVGAGLALVKAIVESHGGSVRVESSPGRGSTFYLRFPGAMWQKSADGEGLTVPAGSRSEP